MQAVTAGRFELATDGTSVGRFVYGINYRERPDAVEFDPVELKLAPRTYETAKGVFGALRDAGPDRWGRQIIERRVGRTQLSEIDYLLKSPDDRAGALGLRQEPPAPRLGFNRTLDLEKLQALAKAIVDEEKNRDEAAVQVEELLLLGTSMGGARPKAVVEDREGLWIAKFNRPDDRWNSARVEHAMLALGRNCGLTTAESKVVSVAGRDVLLVRRFDRERADGGYLRARMASGLTLLRADESLRDRWSYVLLAEELRRVCAQPRKQANELFRRMCFNALISNVDDHPRNHAILAKERNWELSPAYDLTPFAPVGLERRDLALICGDNGRYANRDNILCARFLLDRQEADAVVTEMEMNVRNGWYQVVRSEGVSERDCDAIRGAFAYPG